MEYLKATKKAVKDSRRQHKKRLLLLNTEQKKRIKPKHKVPVMIDAGSTNFL